MSELCEELHQLMEKRKASSLAKSAKIREEQEEKKRKTAEIAARIARESANKRGALSGLHSGGFTFNAAGGKSTNLAALLGGLARRESGEML